MTGQSSPEVLTSWDRLWIIIGNGARHLVVPLANFVISYLVVSMASAELWGEFVVRLVVVTLTVHVLSWGNHEYLLRAFSRNPEALGSLWRRSILTRGVFLIGAVAGPLILGLRGAELGWALLWLGAAFAHQSLAVVVLFSRRFAVAVAAELTGLVVTAGLLLSHGGAMDVTVVVKAVALGMTARVVVGFAAFFGTLLAGGSATLDHRHITQAVPFFLAGLSGLLASKADLYVVSAVLSNSEVGAYQVTVSLIAVLQGLAAIAYTPFVRDLYASSDSLSRGSSRRLMAAGLLCSVAAVPAGWLILNVLYGLNPPWSVLAVAAASVFPVYGTLPLVYSLYKVGREKRVIVVTFVGTAINIGLALGLVPVFGIVGGLAAGAATQWVIFGWLFTTRNQLSTVTEEGS